MPITLTGLDSLLSQVWIVLQASPAPHRSGLARETIDLNNYAFYYNCAGIIFVKA